MSLILDALRKSDRQRARQASERLREGPRAARQDSASRAFLVMIAVFVLAAAIVAGIAFRSPPSRTAAGAGAQIMENVAAEPARAAVRDLAGELATPRLAPPAPALPAVTGAPVMAATPDASAEELRAPPLAALADLRRQLPPLHVDIHAWAADPAARFVLINLRRYGEGDRLQEGPVVRRILKNGVVLEFQGRLFSLPRT